MNREDADVRGFFSSLRWQLASLGWMAQPLLVLSYRPWEWRLRVVVAIGLFLRALALAFLVKPGHPLARRVWGLMLVTDLGRVS